LNCLFKGALSAKLYPLINDQYTTPYNRLSGQQMLSGTQIISTSHGMTGRNFFEFIVVKITQAFYLEVTNLTKISKKVVC
jgi:hypothetical protein